MELGLASAVTQYICILMYMQFPHQCKYFLEEIRISCPQFHNLLDLGDEVKVHVRFKFPGFRLSLCRVLKYNILLQYSNKKDDIFTHEYLASCHSHCQFSIACSIIQMEDFITVCRQSPLDGQRRGVARPKHFVALLHSTKPPVSIPCMETSRKASRSLRMMLGRLARPNYSMKSAKWWQCSATMYQCVATSEHNVSLVWLFV